MPVPETTSKWPTLATPMRWPAETSHQRSLPISEINSLHEELQECEDQKENYPDARKRPCPDARKRPCPDARGQSMPRSQSNARKRPCPDARKKPCPDVRGQSMPRGQSNAWKRPYPDAKGGCHASTLVRCQYKTTVVNEVTGPTEDEVAGVNEDSIEAANKTTGASSATPNEAPSEVYTEAAKETSKQHNHNMPDLASMTKHIDDLLEKEKQYIWGEEQKEAWSRIHKILAVYLKTYHSDRKKKSIVISDMASITGLNEVLAQASSDGTRSLTACCTKTNTDKEVKYTASEAQLLVEVYPHRRFYLHLTGAKPHPVIVLSGQRSLKGTMEKRLDKMLKSRFKGMRLRPQNHNSKTSYMVTAKVILADLPSRRPHIGTQEINEAPKSYGNNAISLTSSSVVRYQGKIREDIGLEQGLLAGCKEQPMKGDSSLVPGEGHFEVLSTGQDAAISTTIQSLPRIAASSGAMSEAKEDPTLSSGVILDWPCNPPLRHHFGSVSLTPGGVNSPTYGTSEVTMKALGATLPITSRLFGHNLAYGVNKAKLREVFSMSGRIVEATLCRHDDEETRGKATIKYAHPSGAVQTTMMFRDAKLFSRTCGLIGPRSSDIRITDRYGNTYSFGQGTSEEQIAAIPSVPTGVVSAACNDAQTDFAKTDNLELRIAPTRSPSNAADNWRIIRACQDTDSGVCLVALDVARQTGMLLNPGTQGLESMKNPDTHQGISSSTRRKLSSTSLIRQETTHAAPWILVSRDEATNSNIILVLNEKSTSSPKLNEKSTSSPKLNGNSTSSPNLNEESTFSQVLNEKSTFRSMLNEKSTSSPMLKEKSTSSTTIFKSAQQPTGKWLLLQLDVTTMLLDVATILLDVAIMLLDVATMSLDVAPMLLLPLPINHLASNQHKE